jgi:hypothetical protein
MEKSELKQAVQTMLERLSKLTFSEAEAFVVPVQECHGNPGENDFYQIDVRLLERNSDRTGEWLKLIVSANDGTGILGVVNNVTGGVAVYRNGSNEIF